MEKTIDKRQKTAQARNNVDDEKGAQIKSPQYNHPECEAINKKRRYAIDKRGKHQTNKGKEIAGKSGKEIYKANHSEMSKDK
jgi:hypothetical protein